ncbi:anti-sigma factor domain-containing protein [Planococcus sp. X10-3]|uniref:anti-sigma factor n=1 Tax=Planococcus sp. X10-3 TaxID=3061240 RepID=UPI003BAE6159
MNNELCDQLVDYLNGTLSKEETRQFEEHLKTCDECREIADATGQLPYLSEPAEPPAGMKSRILANVFAEEGASDSSSASSASSAAASSAAGSKAASSSSHAESDARVRTPREENDSNVVPMTDRGRKRNWATPLIAAVLLASLIGNAYAFMQLQQEQTEPVPPAEPTEPTTAFKSIELQPSEDFTGGGTAALIEEEDGALNLVVQGQQLAALEGEQVYQVWLIEGDNPIPAGAFTTNANGEGATYFNIDNNTEEWDTIAITLEPQPGNELPQGQVVLSGGI